MGAFLAQDQRVPSGHADRSTRVGSFGDRRAVADPLSALIAAYHAAAVLSTSRGVADAGVDRGAEGEPDTGLRQAAAKA